MLTRIRDDERGVAMIVALMVTFVVMMLAAVVFAEALHNSSASAYDRKRLQSVDSAEAGLDYFYNALEHTQASGLTSIPTTGSVAASPGSATFTATPTWYSDTTGCGTCVITGPFSDSYFPHSVKVVSVGTTNGTTTRTMETFMTLTPAFGGFAGAVVTENCLSLVNSFTITGNTVYDGDVFVTNCNAAMTSGNQTIKGNVYVSCTAPNTTNCGSLNIGTQVHIYGDVWAYKDITVNQPNALVDHNAISSTSSLAVPAGTVTGSGTYCTTVSGTSNIHGGTIRQCQGPPPSPGFPHIGYVDTGAPAPAPSPPVANSFYRAATDPSWYGSNVQGCSTTPVSNCYEELVFGSVGDATSTACTNARNYIEGTGAGTWNGGNGPPNLGTTPGTYSGVVVRILSSCTYASSNNVTVNLNADLAIISNGSISLSQRSTWNGVCNSTPTQCVGTAGAAPTRKMFLMAPWLPNALATSPTNPCPTGDITVGNNTNLNSLVAVGLYTPCTAHMSNQNAFYGQVVGRSVDIGNNWNMNFRPVVFPGAHVTGFTQDVAYIREIA
jgi:Tfp pilus assembly protein PilX